MINEDRIVPVTKTDLLSLYGLIIKQTEAGAEAEALPSDDVLGNFKIEEAGVYIANQPVVTCDIATGVDATIYFIADAFYGGFTIDGEAVEATGDEVESVNGTLYMAEVDTGAITITKMGV